MKKILILTAPFGNGHVQVAKQLEEEILKHPGYEVEIYDFFSEQYGRTTKLVKFFNDGQYKSRLANQIYRMVFYNSDRILKTRIAKYYNYFGLERLKEKVLEDQLDIIINTYPINCTYYLKTKQINIPVYNVITDYFANANWINKGVKRHFISSENVKDQFKNHDVQDEQIEVTGIPIRDAFYQTYTQEAIERLKEKYNIKTNKKVVLIIARTNCSKLKSMIRLFEREDITVLIVCGYNKSLYKKINSRFAHFDHIKVFGYVDHIHELMFISDVMVTKPGGVTITEASRVGLPLVLLKPIYGQELENALHFESNNASRIAHNYKQVYIQVMDLLKDDELLKLKKDIQMMTKGYSTKEIIDSILRDLEPVVNEPYMFLRSIGQDFRNKLEI